MSAPEDYPLIAPALDILDRAIELDPEFVEAYELKAMFYWMAGGFFTPAEESRVKVYEAASKALELDPTSITARTFAITAAPGGWTWLSGPTRCFSVR